MAKRNQKLRKQCPFEAAMDIIGSKWKGAILFELMKNGTMRFSELKASIPSISQRMLTLQLRELEVDNLVIRQTYLQSPPKVEYSLSKIGESLKPILYDLREWGKQFV